MRVNWKAVLPIAQVCLLAAAYLVSQITTGEGSNQLLANMLSNLDYYVRLNVFSAGDIVHYTFRPLSALISIALWFIIGAVIDYVVHRYRSRTSTGR